MQGTKLRKGLCAAESKFSHFKLTATLCCWRKEVVSYRKQLILGKYK